MKPGRIPVKTGIQNPIGGATLDTRSSRVCEKRTFSRISGFRLHIDFNTFRYFDGAACH